MAEPLEKFQDTEGNNTSDNEDESQNVTYRRKEALQSAMSTTSRDTKHNPPQSQSAPAEHSTVVTYVVRDDNFKSWNLKFTGDSSIVDFFLRIDDCMRTRDVPEQKIVKCFSDFLSGKALDYYRQIRDSVVTLEDLQNKFRTFFSSFDSDFISEKQIRDHKQNLGQPLHIYVLDMQTLNSRLTLPLSEATLIEIIKHNLLPTYAQLLAVNDIQTIDRLITLGKRYEAYAVTTSGNSSSKPIKGQKQVTVVNTQYKKKETLVITCQKCKKSGHSYKQCRSIPGIVCFKCGTKGVITSRCSKCNPPTDTHPVQTKNSKKLERPGVTASCSNKQHLGTVTPGSSSEKLDNRIFVEFLIKNIPYIGLLDTGANLSVIGNGYHKQLLDFGFQITPTNWSAKCANGSQVQTIGVMTIPVTFRNKNWEIAFMVIPEISDNFILGMDFVHQFGILNYFNFHSIELVGKTEDTHPQTSNKLCGITSKSELSPLENIELGKIIDKFKTISTEEKGLGETNIIEHRIVTTGSPIKQKYYPLSPVKLQALNDEVDRMLELGVIAPSKSPWSNPVVMTPKKDGSLRFCLDARKLNDVTIKDSYPLPYISSILDNLKGARYLSSIDLSAAYWQLPLCDSDNLDGNGTSCQKTAFVVPNRGLFEFKRMPFGLCNAGCDMQRLIDSLFQHKYGEKIFGYCDDLLIATSSFKEHINILNDVLETLKQAGLTINFNKCEFCKDELHYLGYVVSSKGLQTDPKKLDCIRNFPRPTTARQLRAFIGLCSYYRRFVNNFSTIIAPMTALIGKRKGKEAIAWCSEAETSFISLKEALTQAPVLACPDFKIPFQIHTDASSVGIGSVLVQEIDGIEHPVAFHSRLLSKTERNYSTTERELLAVVDSVIHFRPYIDCSHFILVTDHMCLKWLKTLNNPSGRLARWAMQLACFDFEIRHRKGALHVVPDVLSRAELNAVTFTGGSNSGDDWYNKLFKNVQSNPIFHKNYQIKDNTLYRFSKPSSKLHEANSWKIVLPQDIVQECIKENHELTAIHPGTFKTLAKIKENYFWKGMNADVKSYVSNCEKCKAYKHSNDVPHGHMTHQKQVERPMHTLSIDTIGPLPKSYSGHIYILSIVDIFTKYCWLHPLRTATTKTVTSFIESEIILKEGTPCVIICDNATIFQSKDFKNFCTKYSIPKIFYNAYYSPQSNTVERYNQTIQTCLAMLVEEDQRNWSRFLPQIQLFMNTTINLATGYTPYFLARGREIISDGSLHTLRGNAPQSIDDVQLANRNEKANSLNELADIFQRVSSALTKAYKHNANRYNLRRRELRLRVGDIVWRRNFVQSNAAKFFSAKLAPRFIKCKVVDKLSDVVYQLEETDTGNIGKYHVKDIIKVPI